MYLHNQHLLHEVMCVGVGVHVFVYYQETGNHCLHKVDRTLVVSGSLSIAKIPPNCEAEASHHDSKLPLLGYN